MPFLLEHNRYAAISHLDNGTFERSNGVPTVTVNCSRQSTHFHRPGLCALPWSWYGLSALPQ